MISIARYLRFAKLPSLLLAGVLLSSSQEGLSQDDGDDEDTPTFLEKDNDKADKRSRKRRRTKKKKVIYDYELMGSLEFHQNTGSLKNSAEQEETFSRQIISTSLTSGFVFGNHFEPIFEATYQTTSTTITNLTTESSYMTLGVGALFNLPITSTKSGDATTNGRLSEVRWVPYGGFLVDMVTLSETGTLNSSLSSSGSEIRTKLYLGLRYVLYHHLAVNMGAKVSYESSAGEGTDSDGSKTGGSQNRLNIDLRILSFSVLI